MSSSLYKNHDGGMHPDSIMLYGFVLWGTILGILILPIVIILVMFISRKNRDAAQWHETLSLEDIVETNDGKYAVGDKTFPTHWDALEHMEFMNRCGKHGQSNKAL